MSAPDLTVVCVAGPRRRHLDGLLAALEAQTARDRLELLIAVGAHGRAEPGGRLRTVTSGVTLGEMRAAGARAARAPLVAYLFDHCHPRPGWAQAVIDAFAPGVSAVGYVFEDDDGASYPARAALCSDFAAWTVAATPGPVDRLAWQDVAYRRCDLLALGPQLDRLLDFDDPVFVELRRGGAVLVLAAGAVVRHAGLRDLRDNMGASHAYSRLVAARAAEREGLDRRRRMLRAALLGLVAPPLGLVRLSCLVARSPARLARLVALLPAIALFQLAGAAGLARGCLSGEGPAAMDVRRAELELDRSAAYT